VTIFSLPGSALPGTMSAYRNQKGATETLETMHVTQAGQGEHLQVVTDVVTIKASGRDTSGKILMIEARVPPGGGPPGLHRHYSAEIFYILEGEFEFTIADVAGKLSTAKLTAGDTLAVPSLVWHNFKNVGTTPGKFLTIHSPAGMEDFAREIGTPIEDPCNPPQAEGPPSEEQRQRLMETIGKYMEMMPPGARSETV
jgi:mannose-6-phosphate isomerase-like protein (cupin superfamily)